MSHSEGEFSMAISTALCKRTQDCWPTTPNIVGCDLLHPFAHLLHVVVCFWELLRKSLKQLPTFLLFHDCQSVAQHFWICLPTPFNIVGARHPRYSWFCGLYPSHDALQVTTLWGVVTSICTPLPTHTQQLPIMLGVVTSFRTYLKKTPVLSTTLSGLILFLSENLSRSSGSLFWTAAGNPASCADVFTFSQKALTECVTFYSIEYFHQSVWEC